MPHVDQARTKSAYGLQWNQFRIIRPEEDRATFRNRTGLNPTTSRVKVVLDAGCGMGRYLRIAAESSASLIVGLDLSHAVVAARELTTELPGVAVVRGDLLRLPFAAGELRPDLLSRSPRPHARPSRGVSRAGQALEARRPHRRLGLPSRARRRGMDHERPARLFDPPAVGLLEFLCRLAVPFGGLKRKLMASRWRLIERLGVALHLATIGVSMHPDPEVRVCDTLDWYAPKFMSRHTFEEVAGWFRDAGLTDLVDLTRDQVFFHEGQGNGINFAGRRPRDLI